MSEFYGIHPRTGMLTLYVSWLRRLVADLSLWRAV
jgi:hypothetical protein